MGRYNLKWNIFYYSMMTSVLELAETIASMSPVAIQGTKINLNYARDHTVEEGLDFVVSTVGEV